MGPYGVSIQVLGDYDDQVSGEGLSSIVECVLAVESLPAGAKVSVVIAGDDVVRELNRRHRGLDETTDVLSFSFVHQGHYYGEREVSANPIGDVEFFLPPGEEPSLGEVIISYPQAQRQAALSGHSVEKELAVLLTHGVLHLLGHDHEEPEDAAAMNLSQSRVLDQVAIDS